MSILTKLEFLLCTHAVTGTADASHTENYTEHIIIYSGIFANVSLFAYIAILRSLLCSLNSWNRSNHAYERTAHWTPTTVDQKKSRRPHPRPRTYSHSLWRSSQISRSVQSDFQWTPWIARWAHMLEISGAGEQKHSQLKLPGYYTMVFGCASDEYCVSRTVSAQSRRWHFPGDAIRYS